MAYSPTQAAVLRFYQKCEGPAPVRDAIIHAKLHPPAGYRAARSLARRGVLVRIPGQSLHTYQIKGGAQGTLPLAPPMPVPAAPATKHAPPARMTYREFTLLADLQGVSVEAGLHQAAKAWLRKA